MQCDSSMKGICIVAIGVLSLVAGCRTPENFVARRSLTEKPTETSSNLIAGNRAIHRSAAPALDREDVPQSYRTADARQSVVSAVAFRQELSNSEPPVAETQPNTVERLPSLPTAELVKSNLTLADLESMAMQNNPALHEAAALVEAAQGNWVQVGLPPNPVIGYSGQQLSSHGQAEQQGIFLGQKFVTGKKLRLNRQVADWELQRVERELEAVRLRVLTDVRIGYYDVLIAQRRRELAADLVRISEQGTKAAQLLFEGEEVSEADPLRARVEAEMAQILLQTSTNQHVEAWRRLIAVLGMPELAHQRLKGELKPDGIALSWQETLQQVLSESPEIAAAIADVEATQWAVERAYAEVKPDVDVQAVFQDDRGTGSSNGNLQVTLPIPIINRNQGRIQQAEAQAAAAERAVDRLALDLQTRLAAAFQRYESARNQVEKYSRTGGILENADRTLELIRTGYQAEEFGVIELLAAQRTYFQTNLAYLESLRTVGVRHGNPRAYADR